MIEEKFMNDYQQTTLWLGALRYYVGRRTGAVSDFTSALIQEWHNLPTETQDFIKCDLEREFDKDDRTRENFSYNGARMWALGDDCDRVCWEQVRRLWTDETGEIG
jgi:hypothetical protein